MSYIQIELGGKSRGLKFNNRAIDAYWGKINFKEVEGSSVYAAIYAGLIGNDIAKGIQNSDYDYELVTEWVDELENNNPDSLGEALKMFTESQSYKSKLEKIQKYSMLLQNNNEKKKMKKKK